MPLPEIPIRSFSTAVAEDPTLQRALRAAHEAAHPALVANESAAHGAVGGRDLRSTHAEEHAALATNEMLTRPASLVVDCMTLYRDLRFDEGLARARRDAGWESAPDARLHVAIGLHYKGLYDEARAEYAAAAARSASPSFRATCVANAGAAWYEQGDFEQALARFEESLAIDPLNEFGLMGAVAVAAERRDAEEVVRLSARVRERWPAWQGRTVIVQLLTTDRSYRFLRKTPGLFERAFGVSLDALLAG